jgi:peptidoglycan/LPS O-acetylase OafA/YrhL
MSTYAAVVPEVVAPKRHAEVFYRPGLDMLRALAFLVVFVAHGYLWELDQPSALGAIARSGEFGVCIFFFLSSYLITELLLREKREAGTVQIPAFYARRVLRIWPLYFAVIGAGCLYGLVSHSHHVSQAWGASLMLLFTNWYTIGHGYPPGFLFPLWSISLEEQFYLIWPGLAKYLNRRGLLAMAILLMIVAYATLALLLHQGASLDPGIWVNSLVQFQYFALGTMTALVLRGRMPNLPIPLRVALFAAGLLCLRAAQAAVFTTDTNLPHDFAHIAPRYLIAMAGCLCFFFSFVQLSMGKWQQPFIYLGKISYGLYVFHVLWLGLARNVLQQFLGDDFSHAALQLAAMALALPATVISAILSYRYLETPFLRFKKNFTVVFSRAV